MLARGFVQATRACFGWDTIGSRETAAMARTDLSPTDALRSAMAVAARTLGREEEIGRIADGHAADVIAVGDPLENVWVMEDVRFVVRDRTVGKAP